MINQPVLLYATDTLTNTTFIVVGWRTSATSTDLLPYLAPCQDHGVVRPADPRQAANLTYSGAPARSPMADRTGIRYRNPLGRQPSDETAVLPSVPPSSRLRP
jgi:hypothetical protein